jgi:hypothetical protein
MLQTIIINIIIIIIIINGPTYFICGGSWR